MDATSVIGWLLCPHHAPVRELDARFAISAFIIFHASADIENGYSPSYIS
jgi:hypothetical protein